MKLPPTKILALAAALLLAAGSAFANPSVQVTTGNWSNTGTWSTGAVPLGSSGPGIGNNSTITFQEGDSYTGGGWQQGLLIGYDSWGSNWSLANPGSGTLNVTGGTMSTGYLGLGAGLNFNGPETGTLNISGGTVTAADTLLVGWSTTPGSSINVSGGTFNMAGGAADYNIGQGAAATLNVSGGTVNMNRTVNILNGSSVNVSGTGVMNINEYFITGGTVNVSGGTLNFQRAGGSHFGLSTTAVMTLSGGQVNAVTDLFLGLAGNGTVNQSGGIFSTGTQQFSLGAASGTAAYNQSGGTLETSAFSSGGGTASYTFSGGTLKATGGLNLATSGITTSITGTNGSGATIDSSNNTVTVNAAQIALGASGSLTKIGSGTLAINNDAGFSTGTWNVNAGTVNMVGYFNGAALNVAGGTLNINRVGGAHISLSSASTATLSSGAINNTGDLYLGYSAGGNATLNQSGGALGVTGIFTVGGNGGAATWNISGGTQSITGALDVYTNSAININSGGTLGKLATIQNGGVVNVNTGGVLGDGATVNGGGLLKFNGGNGAGVAGKYVTLNGGTVDVNGQNIADLTWDAVISSAPGSKIANSSATAATINNTVPGNTIWLWDGAGTNTTIETVGNLTIHSWITDVDQSISQGITKTGAGTLDLTYGGNNYRGGTRVSAGTLLVSNLSGSATGSGAVTVEAGGTLGGSGIISGSVVLAGGRLNPGNSPGLLTAGSLDLNSGTTTMEMISGTTRGTTYDAINITTGGAVDFGGALAFSFLNNADFANGTSFNLFSFDTTSLGNFSEITSTGWDDYAGLTWAQIDGIWSATAGNGQTLNFSELDGSLNVVPEPSTYALLAFAAAGLGAHLTRRRRR